MIDINNLPDELVLRVVEQLSSNDVEAFSCTAKRMHTLSSARLDHYKTLQAKYRAVILADSVEGGITHPVQLLYDIWKNPIVADCVRYITFVSGDSYDFDSSQVDDETRDILGRSHGVRDLLQGSSYFSHHDEYRRRCLDEILAGKESAAFALLLVSLPNLERLRFSRPRWDKRLLSSILTSLVASDPHSTVLSKLLTVESYHSDTEGEASIDDLMLFALAPFIRTLRGTTVSGDIAMFSSIPEWHTAVSRLERLELSAGAIEPEAVKTLLLPMRNLRELRYCHNCYSLGGEAFDINAWVEALADSIAGTLQVLSLTNPDGATTTVKSFKAFPRLRELELEVQSLIIDEDDNISLDSEADALDSGFHQTEEDQALVPQLVDILPPSIESITLLIGGHEDETRVLLSDLVPQKDQYLPHLTKLTYGGRTLDQDIKDGLKSVGITIGRKKRAFTPKHVQFWEEDPPLSQT